MNATRVAVDVDCRLLDIGNPSAGRLAIRVAHIVSERDAFAANLTAVLQLSCFSPCVGS